MVHLLEVFLPQGESKEKPGMGVSGKALEGGGDNLQILFVRIFFGFVEQGHERIFVVPHGVTAFSLFIELDVGKGVGNEPVDGVFEKCRRKAHNQGRDKNRYLRPKQGLQKGYMIILKNTDTRILQPTGKAAHACGDILVFQVKAFYAMSPQREKSMQRFEVLPEGFALLPGIPVYKKYSHEKAPFLTNTIRVSLSCPA